MSDFLHPDAGLLAPSTHQAQLRIMSVGISLCFLTISNAFVFFMPVVRSLLPRRARQVELPDFIYLFRPYFPLVGHVVSIDMKLFLIPYNPCISLQLIMCKLLLCADSHVHNDIY